MIHKFTQGNVHLVVDVNSGAVHIVDKIVYDVLDYFPGGDLKDITENLQSTYDQDDLKTAFEEVNFLIEEGQLFGEDEYINDLHFQNKKPVIKAMCLHIAHDCNIRCAYCFASQGDFKGDRSMMSLEVGKKSLEFLATNSGNRRNLEVDFFGGEPLMNFDVVKQLVTYGRELEKKYNKNFRFTLTTNGVLLSEENMDYINENMENVVLSIDGRKAVNDKMRYTISGDGTYDIILPKLKELVDRRKGKQYYVRGTFTKHNIDFAKDVLHLADQGFKSTSIEPVVAEPHHEYALSESDLDTIFEQYEILSDELIKRKNTKDEFSFFHFMLDLGQGPCVIKRLSGCGAGAEYVAITPEGDIYPCHQFVGDENFKMGNVLEETMDMSINSHFKNAHVYNKPACKDCWAKFYCSGGCHANAHNFNNDILVPYDLGCEMEKKRLECSLYIQAKLMMEEDHD